MRLDIKQTDDGVTFSVKVVPGSSRSVIAGLLGDALKINVAASPEKGKANKELLKLLAKLLGKPKSALAIVSGLGNSHKEIHISGISPEQLRGSLAEYLT